MSFFSSQVQGALGTGVCLFHFSSPTPNNVSHKTLPLPPEERSVPGPEVLGHRSIRVDSGSLFLQDSEN